MNPRYPAVAERADHRCEYCHAPDAIFNFPFEVDHIIPPSHGGTDEESNFALSCRGCNVHKHGFVEAVNPETGAMVPLFHPRRDGWHEHFRADVETGEIIGLTATGRATVIRLKMNAPNQSAARRQWSDLGLFP